MQLAERHIIKSTEHRFALIDGLAFESKNLYNAANYVIRQSFVYGWGYINYNEMNRLMKSHQTYSTRQGGAGRKLRIVSFVAERKRIPKMPQPYSYDLRQKVIQAIKLDGLKIIEASQLFNISRSRVHSMAEATRANRRLSSFTQSASG